MGVSGSGKTTLASLLPRLYDVQRGRILIDGIDIRDYSLRALRSAIAVVQQDSFLFSGTIRDNILYGKPEANEAEMIAAALDLANDVTWRLRVAPNRVYISGVEAGATGAMRLGSRSRSCASVCAVVATSTIT